MIHTRCKVTELIPPAVQTGLAGAQNSHGAVLDDFADAVYAKMLAGDKDEIGYGATESLEPQLASKLVSLLFEQSAARFPVAQYES